MISFQWNNLSNTKQNSFFEQVDFAVEELLDQEDIIEDIRFHFNTASNYFQSHPHLIQGMLHYVLENQTKIYEDNKTFKFSFVASEIFACELPGILDHFFNENLNDEKIDGISPTDGVLKQINFENLFEFEGELNIGNQTEEEEKNKEYDKTILETSQNKNSFLKLKKKIVRNFLMEKLFSLLKNDELLNESNLQFFKKIFFSLMNQKGFETISYIYNHEEFLNDLLKNISAHSILAEITYKILLIDCCYTQMNSQLFLEERKKIIVQIYTKLRRAALREENLENSIFILTELLNNFMKGNAGKELLSFIINEQSFEIIFELFEKKNEEITKNISNLLYNFLNFIINQMNTSYISKSPFELERNGQDNTNLIVLIEKNIIPMIEILFDQNCKTGSTKTTFGVPVKIFGLGRMKLVECFHLLLKLENEEIFKTLQFYKFFPKYLELFERFPTNNILHNFLYSFLETSLLLNSSYLTFSLCEETKLIEFLIENLISFDPKEKTIKFQKTYVGHLINLANLLNDPKLESNTDLTKFLSENEEWQEFISTKLIIINQIHNSDLGGHNPRKPSKLHYQQEKEELDDFDLLFIDNNRANNQENSYDAHDKYGIEEYQFDEPDYEIENHDDIPDFLMKYEPEVEENLLNEQFDFVGAQISGITSKE